ncbi:hypothetical protein GCM10009603_10730 [Nocardiopsis exhalans]
MFTPYLHQGFGHRSCRFHSTSHPTSADLLRFQNRAAEGAQLDTQTSVWTLQNATWFTPKMAGSGHKYFREPQTTPPHTPPRVLVMTARRLYGEPEALNPDCREGTGPEAQDDVRFLPRRQPDVDECGDPHREKRPNPARPRTPVPPRPVRPVAPTAQEAGTGSQERSR